MRFIAGTIKLPVLILSALAVYLGLLNVVDRVYWVQPDDGIRWEQGDQGLSVASTSFVESSKIRPGDRLLDINGISVRNLNEHTEVLEALSQGFDRAVVADYTLQSESAGELTVPVRIELASQFSATDYPLAAVAFTFLLIGLFIFLRSWPSKGALHFYFICLVAFVLLLYRHSGRGDGFDIGIYSISAVAFLLLPPLFLHFCCYFPERIQGLPKGWFPKAAIYLPSLFLGVIHGLWLSGGLRPWGLARSQTVAQRLDQFELFSFLAYFMLAGVILVYSWRHSKSHIQRKQMKWVSYGTSLGVAPFAILYGAPYLMNLPISWWMEASVLSLGLIPVSFAYAITRYRLMDVDLIFKQGASYIIASSALLALYVGAALTMAHTLRGFSTETGFFVLAATALLIAFLFAPLRGAIQEQIDRFFYKEQYDYRRSIANFGRTLTTEIQLDVLAEKVCDRIQKTLSVAPVALYLRKDGQSSEYRLYTVKGFQDRNAKHSILVPEKHLLKNPDGLELSSNGAGGPEMDELRQELTTDGFTYLHPLRVRGRLIGLLALGKGVDGEFLTSEDLQMVSTLSDYAAIAIDNSVLYQSLEAKAGELAQLKAYSENVIESITIGVAVISVDGTITVWNSSMRRLSGKTPEETIGKNVLEVLPADLLDAIEGIVDGPDWFLQESARLFKTRLSFSDAEDRLVDVILTPFILRPDVYTGALLLIDDITDKVRLEGQLIQAEKLSSIGLFAAGLAHEVNTPLAGISSYSQMLLEETPKDDPRHELLQKIERQSFRASEIINNLLNFTRFSDSDFEEVNINSLMIDTLSLLDHQFRKNEVEVKVDLDPSLPMTTGSGGKLQQVFMNLFLNAKDAMPKGGRLQIKTYARNSDLMVEVSDSGVGITRKDIKRIYDPFFTTKGVGKGTGLGLSISYGIIQEHAGRIEVQSNPGEGTVFRLSLPVKRVQ